MSCASGSCCRRSCSLWRRRVRLVPGSLWVSDKADKPMAGAARTAMAWLTAITPIEFADRVGAQHLSVTPREHAQNKAIDVTAVRRAIDLERKVRIGYKDVVVESSERVTGPFFISHRNGGRPICAWCKRRDDLRHFRIDRMVTASEMPVRCPRRRHNLIRLWCEL